MSKIYYKITSVEKIFSSLNDAKIYIWFNYTDESRKVLDGEYIVKYINDEPATAKKIKYKGDKYGFSRTVRLK